MFFLIAYIKFLFRSKNEHGVHSPFVYNLVTKCFYDRKKYNSYDLLRAYRKNLLHDHRKIKVTDFGAGSRVFSSNERKISAIAKNAGITPRGAQLLNRLVRYLQVTNALELGTSLGIGTAAMAAGNELRILTIEGCPQTASVARAKLGQFHFGNVKFSVGEFSEVLDKELTTRKLFQEATEKHPEPPTFDLIYIDGNHQKEPSLHYFRKLLAFTHNDSLIIFDDIHWSAEMEEAWKEIKEDPAVKVSIDTFFWGLVFFRREQEKEHFVIRV